jgi:cysteine sulfinate desulfinase/cysteine desulfurase-like protein
MLSAAGHKLYAPKGIGFLFARKPLKIEPFCHGAGQEKGMRAMNIPIEWAKGTIRFSTGRMTTSSQIDRRTIEVVVDVITRLRQV